MIQESPAPRYRYMTVIAQDPSIRRADGTIVMAKVAVPAEDLRQGPMGYRVHVVDYDTTRDVFRGAHELPATYDEEPPSWRKGSPGIVADERFHAQNVYALVMRTLSRFEFALGRRIGWSFDNHQLKVAPHGMVDANAFYSPAHEGLVFGYFRGTSNGSVYTALSHDVVVHETTHALLDALRERYLMPSNPDQAAFHEGFADVIALLSVFALPEVVEHLLQPEGSGRRGERLISRDRLTPEALRLSALFGLADEMGQEVSGVRGEALRRSAELIPRPDLRDAPEFDAPHRRGEIFVAAVMQSFITAWSARIASLGPKTQRRYPLARVAEEGADIAASLVTLWIRAIDYMPPVHLTFADALTAALTSDSEARPDDSRYGLRAGLKTGFAAFGIDPLGPADRPDCWRKAPPELRYGRVRFESMRSDADEVFRFLWENQEALELRTDAYAKVQSVRPCIRIGEDGFVLRETVAEYYQVAHLTPDELRFKGIRLPREFVAQARREAAARHARRLARMARAADEGDAPPGDEEDEVTVPLHGGGVLIFDEYGRLKYHVQNDVFGKKQEARLSYLVAAGMLRIKAGNAAFRAARLSTLHRLRAIDSRRWPSEGW